MIQSVIHASENDNLYLYNDQNRLSLLIHPDLKNIHESVININIDPYYKGKYEYFKKHGFLSDSKPSNLAAVIDDLMVKKSIMQTSQILFEVTDSCNLKCFYCAQGELYENSTRNNKNININSSINLLKYIFDIKCQNKKNETLYIGFYGGEPLLNIKFIKQIIETVSQLNIKKNISIHYLMTTNAVLIDKHIDFLAANDFTILVSLDGNKENNSYRVCRENNKNSFRIVIKNIDNVKKKYPKYFTNNINFNAVLHDKNSVKDIYEFIYNRYQKIPKISELNMINANPDRYSILKKMFQRTRRSEAEYQNEKFNRQPHNELISYHELTDFLKYFSINFYISNIHSSFLNEEKNLPSGTCLPFSKKIFLTTCNELLPCEKISNKYSLGKANQNVEIDIPSVTRKYNFYYGHLIKHCQHCYIHRFCGLCMFNIEKFDMLTTEEFVCENFHDQKSFQHKLYRVFSFLEKYPNDFFEILEHVVLLP